MSAVLGNIAGVALQALLAVIGFVILVAIGPKVIYDMFERAKDLTEPD